MKKLCTLFSFLFLLSLSSCNKVEEIIPKENFLSTIFIASDLHLFSNNLVDEGIKEIATNDGRIQEYDYQLVQSLVDEVNASQPNYLVLTGDLSFNGEKDSHLELVKMLDQINNSTKVLVIPGNHDTYNLLSKSYIDGKSSPVDSVSHEEFKEIYSNYGYTGGISYDEETLSYFYSLDDSTYGLFIDSNISKYNEEEGINLIGGLLFESTLHWIEENLILAKEQGKRVISFMHHNLITHNPLFESRFTLSNSNELLELFSKYDVRLNFSGHLHIQSIKNTIVNNKKIFDICSQSILDYGNRFGILNVYSNCFEYTSKSLADEELLDYSFNTFYQKYYDKSLYSFELNYPNNCLELLDFCSKINAYYFDGDYQEINRLKKENRKIVRFINSKQFNNNYIKSLIGLPNVNQHQIDIYL